MAGRRRLGGPRRLVLVRHAQAEPAAVAGAGAATDAERGLTTRGRAQCVVTAALLRVQGLAEPDLALVSSARRARQTWTALVEELTGTTTGPPELLARTAVEDGLYETSPTALLHRLAAVPDDVRLLVVVGHEPVLSGTASALAGPGSDGAALALVGVGAPTASAAVLELDGAWGSLAGGACRLTALLVP